MDFETCKAYGWLYLLLQSSFESLKLFFKSNQFPPIKWPTITLDCPQLPCIILAYLLPNTADYSTHTCGEKGLYHFVPALLGGDDGPTIS